MNDIVNAEYALERLRILAEETVRVATLLREKFPQEYESRERLGMLEHAARMFIGEENR